MIVIYIVAFFVLGILIGIFTFGYTKIRPNLSYVFLFLPYMLFSLLSTCRPTQLGDTQIMYFWLVMGVSASWLIKEHIEKSHK